MSADERPDPRWSDEALDKLRDALLKDPVIKNSRPKPSKGGDDQ